MPRSALHHQLYERLCYEFGEPADVQGVNARWSFLPRPGAVSINVAINRDLIRPTAIVFDPYDQLKGVDQLVMTSADEIEQLVMNIRARLELARKGLPSEDGQAVKPEGQKGLNQTG
jgi:hypothetical protein